MNPIFFDILAIFGSQGGGSRVSLPKAKFYPQTERNKKNYGLPPVFLFSFFEGEKLGIVFRLRALIFIKKV